MALPLIVAGVAARAVAKKVATKAAKKSAEKTVKKIVQKSKTNQIAKNSVKVKEADNIKRARSNVDSYYKTVKAYVIPVVPATIFQFVSPRDTIVSGINLSLIVL